MRKGRVILDTVAFLWHCLMAAITPIWVGFTYMFLTGNGKGYDYALRSEADIYVFLALIGMVFWACCTIPTFGFLTRECAKLGRNHRFIPLAVFLLVGLLVICLLGWDNYLMLYGVNA